MHVPPNERRQIPSISNETCTVQHLKALIPRDSSSPPKKHVLKNMEVSKRLTELVQEREIFTQNQAVDQTNTSIW